MKKFGILGCGKMGGAILQGVSRLFKKEEVEICEKNPQTVERLTAQGYTVTEDPVRLVEDCETVLVSVKPQDLSQAVASIKDKQRKVLFLSIAAGQSLERLRALLGDVAIVRAMPNTAATLGLAATCITPNELCTQEQIETATAIFQTVGTVERIEEKYMDEIIALSGSFIAFAYYYAQGFALQAVKDGINEETATRLLAQTFIGAGNMMLSGKPLELLIQDVCSKGGTTLAGLDQLRSHDLHALCALCSTACTQRSKELGK